MPANSKTLQAIQDFHTKLKVSDLSQPNAYTCQSTCIAMAMDLHNVDDIQTIRQELSEIGSPGDPNVMAQLIRKRIQGLPIQYEWHDDACLDDVKGWLEAGDFLITHGWFTGSGHVICLSGLEIDTGNNSYKIEVKDPWSEFDSPKWTYDLRSHFYDGYYF